MLAPSLSHSPSPFHLLAALLTDLPHQTQQYRQKKSFMLLQVPHGAGLLGSKPPSMLRDPDHGRTRPIGSLVPRPPICSRGGLGTRLAYRHIGSDGV